MIKEVTIKVEISDDSNTQIQIYNPTNMPLYELIGLLTVALKSVTDNTIKK